MEIFFGSGKLERICGDGNRARRSLGDICARKLFARLADLEAADCMKVAMLLPGSPHRLTGNLSGHFAMHLENPRRLIFKPADNPIPLTENGAIDLEAVIAITITDIVDYH